jgi:uncharacterized protein (DUF1800 family)
MKMRNRTLPIVLRVGHAALTGMILGSLVVPPAFAAEGAVGGAIPMERHVAPLTQQEKVLHALNRFTFGPRPGDEAAVQKVGLDKWFQMQLHPERIDDAAFDVEMGRYPSMRLSEMELMHRFPSGLMIRRMSKGDLPLPGDPVEHAIYADAEAAYQAKLKKDANGGADAAKTVAGPTHDDGAVMNGAPIMSEGQGVSGPRAAVVGPTHDDGAVMNGAPNMSQGQGVSGPRAAVAGPTHDDGAVMNGAPIMSQGQGVSGPRAAVAGPTHDDGAVMNGAPRSVGSSKIAGPTHDDGAVMNGAPSKLAGGDGMSSRGAQMEVAAAGAVAGAGLVGKGGKAGLKSVVDPMEDADVAAVLALRPDQRMEKLVRMAPAEMLSLRVALRPKDRLALVAGLSPEQVETSAALLGGPERVVAEEAMESRLMRDVDSQRQLQAVMTDFWLNHFNVYLRKNENEPYMLPEYESKVILPHALGKFEDLLVATAQSPAMLTYLDNWESIGPNSPAAGRVARVQQMRPNGKIAQRLPNVQKLPKGINENYGRELMELHTLGVGGGYTQKDVIEVAKCFTGWTVDRPYGGGMGAARKRVDDGTPGAFEFAPNRHEPGSKVVLGHTIKEGGMNEGLEVLHILATSPATAHFISKQLAVRFVSDTPSPALVDRMAATFMKKDGDIAAVLTTMYKSKEFWAPQVYRAKVKTPLEFMTSALRASDARVTNALPLVQAMNRLGMPVYGMQTPNGYSWTAEDWVSSNALISRMNFALVLSGGKVGGTATNWPALLDGDSVASAESEVELETVLLGQPAAARTRAAVMAEFGNPTAQAQAAASFDMRPVEGNGGGKMGGGMMRAVAVAPPVKASELPMDTMAGLLLGSPEFQRR